MPSRDRVVPLMIFGSVMALAMVMLEFSMLADATAGVLRHRRGGVGAEQPAGAPAEAEVQGDRSLCHGSVRARPSCFLQHELEFDGRRRLVRRPGKTHGSNQRRRRDQGILRVELLRLPFEHFVGSEIELRRERLVPPRSQSSAHAARPARIVARNDRFEGVRARCGCCEHGAIVVALEVVQPAVVCLPDFDGRPGQRRRRER